MLVVILGPRTRLARALIRSPAWPREPTFALVARARGDAEELKEREPEALVVLPEEVPSVVSRAEGEVATVACAWGPIHPGDAWREEALESGLRDARTVRNILRASGARPHHLIVVSSALALAPRTERRFYTGWKNLIEGMSVRYARESPGARLSVVYPGRLIQRRSLLRPASLLHTPYSTLAARLARAAAGGRSSPRRIVGIDARLLLAARAVRAALAACSGTP